METNTVLNKDTQKEFVYLVTYSVGAKREKFLVKNHCKVPEAILIEMGDNKITEQIKRIYEVSGGTQSEKKFKSRLKKDSFVEIEDLNELKTYKISLNFDTDGRTENAYSEAVEA